MILDQVKQLSGTLSDTIVEVNNDRSDMSVFSE